MNKEINKENPWQKHWEQERMENWQIYKRLKKTLR